MQPPAAELSDLGTLHGGEREVLELVATGAPLGRTLDKLCRVIDAESGLRSSIFLLDSTGSRLSLAAGPRLPDSWRAAVRSFPTTEMACGAAVMRHEQIISADVCHDPLFARYHHAASQAGIRAAWSTPFYSTHNQPLGTFAVLAGEPGEPSQADLDLVARATRLASIAVERYTTDEALRRSEQLLRLVLDSIPVGVAVMDSAGDLLLNNPASLRIWGGEIRSGPERYAKLKAWWHDTGRRIEGDESASARARVRGETSLNELIDVVTYDGARKTLQHSAVPIRDERQAIVGAVSVNQDVTDRIAAESALEASVTQMQGLATRLMRAQDDERRRIARMLHETTGQDLAALKMLLAGLRRTPGRLSEHDRSVLNEAARLADGLMAGVRTLSYLLHPPLLDEAGLLSAVRWYAKGFAERSGIGVQLDLPADLPRFPQDVETTLFRVVQEALINVHRHADSRTAAVRVRAIGDRVILEIEDRGHGMPPDVLARVTHGARATGVGLAGMRERLQQLGGRVEIESGDRGTTIRAIVPASRASS